MLNGERCIELGADSESYLDRRDHKYPLRHFHYFPRAFEILIFSSKSFFRIILSKFFLFFRFQNLRFSYFYHRTFLSFFSKIFLSKKSSVSFVKKFSFSKKFCFYFVCLFFIFFMSKKVCFSFFCQKHFQFVLFGKIFSSKNGAIATKHFLFFCPKIFRFYFLSKKFSFFSFVKNFFFFFCQFLFFIKKWYFSLTTPVFFFFVTLAEKFCHDFFCLSPAASMAARRSFFFCAFFRLFSISILCFSRAAFWLIPTLFAISSIVVDGSGARGASSALFQRLRNFIRKFHKFWWQTLKFSRQNCWQKNVKLQKKNLLENSNFDGKNFFFRKFHKFSWPKFHWQKKIETKFFFFRKNGTYLPLTVFFPSNFDNCDIRTVSLFPY